MPENPNPKPTAPGPQSEFKRVLLSQIRPSRNNPRKIFRQEMIDTRAASMAEEGQITPIIIRPLTPAELLNDGVIYEIVDGELRYWAALKNGDKEIDAKIEDISPLKAFKTGVSANRNNKMEWFEEYIDMEYLDKNDPDIQRQEIADLFEVDNATVTRAMKIMDALNEASRALVFENFKKTAGSWRIAENTLLKLAELGDLQIVAKALKVAIDDKMTASKAKDLVAWVQAGNPPETFGTAPKTPKVKKAPGINPEALAKALELAEQVGVAKGRGEDPKPAQDRLDAHLAEVKVGLTPPKPEETSHPITSPEGLSQLGQAFKGLFKPDATHSPETSASTPVHAGVSASKGSKPFQIELKPVIHWFKKLGEKLAKLTWKEPFKWEHRVCRKLAHAIVPLHARSTGSSHSHGQSGKSLSQGAMVLFLTVLHWVVYTLCQFVFWWTLVTGLASWVRPGLKPWLEIPFRFTARLALVDFPNWLIPYANSHLLPALLAGGFLLWGYLHAWKVQRDRMLILTLALGLFYFYGRHWANQPELPSQPVSENQVVSTPATVPETVRSEKLESAKLKTSNSKLLTSNSTPVASYQPAVSFNTSASPASSSAVSTLYDPKILDLEIKSLPQNCIVKDEPLTPDEGMPVDVAVSRMQDLIDPDKYTMMIGGGKQIISSVNPTNTTLTIQYKSTDPFSLLGGGNGVMNFLWEDVKYIHANEIVKVRSSELKTSNPGDVIYQCSLIVSGSKYPLTIQCATTDDLEHLVSTMQYFIRHSRLAHDTALAGMPYLHQGLVFGNDDVVEKLWGNSPADKAGIGLGDHLWSVGKAASDPQEKKDFEKGLSSLPVTLFAVSDADWIKANIARNSGMTNVFRPKLRKVSLAAP